tara:strand:- start:171 stop:914 length:744 start_codon:yes stop_codon:yes gene_type:complete
LVYVVCPVPPLATLTGVSKLNVTAAAVAELVRPVPPVKVIFPPDSAADPESPKNVNPLAVAAIVIDPAPGVIVIPEPAVNEAFVRVFPVVSPIKSCPLVYEVCPVPPLATLTGISKFMVTVAPAAELVNPVPPARVIVPPASVAVPESAANVKLKGELVNVTTPEVTTKSPESNEATPLTDVVASSTDIVIVFPDPAVFMAPAPYTFRSFAIGTACPLSVVNEVGIDGTLPGIFIIPACDMESLFVI